MARKSKIVGFTMPPQMAEEFDALCDEESRTKSELFREMFRVYKVYRQTREQKNAQSWALEDNAP